ncbi:MAG: leucine-rich repeat protein [Ruminococcus sp.]|nr:leucine-rich repeat protein [Ruminococcus sp.]
MKVKKLLAVLSSITMAFTVSAGYFPAVIPRAHVITASAEEISAPDLSALFSEPITEDQTSDDGWVYTSSDQGITIKGYSGSETALVIPDEIDGTAVVAIANSAFANNKTITSVDLGSVTTIGYKVFEGCTKLTELTIPKSVKSTGKDGWYGCLEGSSVETVTFEEGIANIPSFVCWKASSVKNVILPEKEDTLDGYTIGQSAFQGTSLSSVTLPESLTAINSYAFADCALLTNIEIPANVSYIGDYVFSGCKRLKAVTLNEGLTTLGGKVFEGTAISEITIPASLNKIDNSSYGPFSGCSTLNYAIISDGMTTVPARLFSGASSMTAVSVPESVKTFGDYAFQNCSSLSRIHAVQSSIAFGPHTFEGCDQLNDKRFTLFDTEKTGFRSNGNISSVNGTINYTVDYKFQDSVANDLSNLVMKLDIPSGVSIMADSVVSSDPTADLSGITNGNVYLTETEGTLSFSVRIVENGNYSVGAAIEFRYNNSTWKQNIGSLKVDVPTVMANTADTTNTLTAEVYGIAGKGANVEIFVNGKSAGNVKANAYTGKYSTTVDLPSAPSGTSFEIYAKSGSATSETVTTTYEEERPAVKKVVMYYNDHKNNFLDITNVLTEGVSPVISYNPAYPLKFEIEVSNPDKVQRLFVTSDKGSEARYLEASYDEASGLWIAEGYFEPDNRSYVPGALNISMIEKGITHLDEETFDFDSFDTLDLPQDVMDNSSVEILEETEDSVLANVTVSNGTSSVTYQHYSENAQGLVIDGKYHTAEEIAKDPEKYGYKKIDFTSTSGDDEYSYYIRSIDSEDVNEDVSKKIKDLAGSVNGYLSGTSILKMLEGEAAENELMEPLISMGNNYVTGQFKEIIGYKSEELFGYNIYGDLTKGISIVGTLAGEVYDFQRAEGNPELQAAVVGYYAVKLFRTFGGEKALMTAAGIAPPASVVLGIAIGLALDLVGDYLDECIEENKAFSFSGFLRFIIDPSGIVYEAVIGNTVEGATVTVYFKDPETGSTVKWNAEDYDQLNPLLTDSEGKYLWDVPEGEWKVVCEKDGYETAESEWLGIPPVRTDVNLALVSKEAPQLESAAISDGQITVKFTKFVDISTVTEETVVPVDFTGTFTIAPQLLSEEDQYADTFILTGDFGDVSAVSVSDAVVSYAGTAAAAGQVNISSGEVSGKLGDVNNDTYIDASDASEVLAEYAAIQTGAAPVLDKAIADVNDDGFVDASDASSILQYYAYTQTGGKSELIDFLQSEGIA